MKKETNLSSPEPESNIYGLGKVYGERSFNSAPLLEFKYRLSECEPIVELIVGVPSSHREALQKAGKSIPVPVKLRALIDTGFVGGLMVAESAVKSFGLKPRNFNRITFSADPDRTFEVYAWQVDLAATFVSPARGGTNVLIDPIAATLVEFVNSATGVDALIGQEILQACVFTYDGKRGIFKLTF